MVSILYSPASFYMVDTVIDILSAIVLFLIAITAFRFYRLSQERKFGLLAGSFLLIAVSFFTEVVFEWLLHNEALEVAGSLFVNDAGLDAVMIGTLFVYRIFFILGLYLLLAIYEEHSTITMFLSSLFLVLLTIFSGAHFFVFNTIAVLLLLAITFVLWCRHAKTRAPRILLASFAVLAVNRLLLAITAIHTAFYLIAIALQLICFFAIFWAYTTYHGKTPLTARHHR